MSLACRVLISVLVGGVAAVALGSAAFGSAAGGTAGVAADDDGVVVLGEFEGALVIGPVATTGRRPVHADPIAASVVLGRWSAPEAGDTVRSPHGRQEWKPVATADGEIRHDDLRAGYAFSTVESDEARGAILEVTGASMVYVNGEPRVGDVYRTGYVRIPVHLREGTNEFLFRSGRGGIRARVVEPRAPFAFHTEDVTVPDLVAGSSGRAHAGVIVLNSTGEWLEGARITATCDDGEGVETVLPPIAPYSLHKAAIGFEVPPSVSGLEGAEDRGGDADWPSEVPLFLTLHPPGDDDVIADQATLDLRVRGGDQTRRVTFVSDIDGSVQHYGLNPAREGNDGSALVLTLHGASVEALNQANSYAGKTWAHIVAPTNRRPFGFDWEDWGRLDALEVLAHASETLDHDPSRVHLTGHSMGGHGAWHVGVLFPDRFAAVGPSAGWISFWSYGGAYEPGEDAGAVERLLRRAASTSETLTMVRNFAHSAVYILHGESDSTVSVDQAREMYELLGEFHTDVRMHIEEGAGHWWDNSGNPGRDCVDWAPMFDLFAARRLPRPEELTWVDFTTTNPGVTSEAWWVRVERQRRPLMATRVEGESDPSRNRLRLATENASALSFDAMAVASPSARRDAGSIRIEAEIDGDTLELEPDTDGRLHVHHDGQRWRAGERARSGDRAVKHPGRSGMFKDAFRNNAVLVIGTKGSAEENTWALARARFDAETFWYRGNGALTVMTDEMFVDAGLDSDRNVVLYGNSETNGAWSAVLEHPSLHLGSGSLLLEGPEETRTEDREDLGVLAILPRAGSETASVGVVGGTGLLGMRVTDRLPYFVSGVHHPDWFVLSPTALFDGEGAVIGAGFFDASWWYDPSESAWRGDGRGDGRGRE